MRDAKGTTRTDSPIETGCSSVKLFNRMFPSSTNWLHGPLLREISKSGMAHTSRF